jgi:hypothetical protein
MISDRFWTDPKHSHYTTENLFTNVLFLTNSYSNIIGVYQVQWRSLGAGIGWTETQMLSAASDLEAKGGLAIDQVTGWVWVKNWWDHNSLSGAFKGKVGPKARAELNQIPERWREAVHVWLADCDVDRILQLSGSPIDAPSNTHPSSSQASLTNHTSNLISTTTSTGGTSIGGGGIRPDLEVLVDAAIWAASKVGGIHNEAGYRSAIKTRIQQTGPSSEDLLTLTAWRAEQTRIHEQGMARQRQVRQAEEDRSTRVLEHERINAAFNSLAPADQALTLQDFQNHIASVNPMVFSLMKKQGLKSPVVQAAFTDFLRTALNPSLETNAA